MFIRITHPVRYHGWTLEADTVLTATADQGFGVIPSSGWTAPHPRVEGAFINVPAGHAVEDPFAGFISMAARDRAWGRA